MSDPTAEPLVSPPSEAHSLAAQVKLLADTPEEVSGLGCCEEAGVDKALF